MTGDEGPLVDQCLSTGSISQKTLNSTANRLDISFVHMTRRPGACVTTLSIVDQPEFSRRWTIPVGQLSRPVSVRLIPFNDTFYPELCKTENFGVVFTVSDQDGELLTDMREATAVMHILDPEGRHILFTMPCERLPVDSNVKVPLGVCRTSFCPTMSVMVRVEVRLAAPTVILRDQRILHPGPVGFCVPTSAWMAELRLVSGSVPYLPGSTITLDVMAVNPPANTKLAVFRFALRILGGVTLLSVHSSYSVVTERAGNILIVVGDASLGGGNLLATLRFRIDAAGTSGVLLFTQIVPQSFQFTPVNAVPYNMPVRALGFSCRSDGYVDVLLDFHRPTALITNRRRPYVINWRRIQLTAVDNPTAIHVVAVHNVMNSFAPVQAKCFSEDPRNFDISSCEVIRAGNRGNLSGLVTVVYQPLSVSVKIESWVPVTATFGITFTTRRTSGRYRVLTTLSAGTRMIHGVDATPFLPGLVGLGVSLSSNTGLWKCFRTGRRFTIGAPTMYSAECGAPSSNDSPSVHRPAYFFLLSVRAMGTPGLGSYVLPPAVISASMSSGTLVLFSNHGMSVGILNVTLGESATRLTSAGNVLTLRNTGESARCIDVQIFPDTVAASGAWAPLIARIPVFPAAPRSLEVTLSTPVILAPDHEDEGDSFIPSSVFVTRASLVFSDGTRLSVQDDRRLRMTSTTLDVSGLAAMGRPGHSGTHTLIFSMDGIRCVTMSVPVNVVTSSVQQASLVCPTCPSVLSLEEDPLSQQFPSQFPSSFLASVVAVRRLLTDGRVVERSEPLIVHSGTAVSLTADGRVAAQTTGEARLTTAFTPGQSITINVIRRWAESVHVLCNSLVCPSNGYGTEVKLAPYGDGASMPPFEYKHQLAVTLSVSLYNGSVFLPRSELEGAALFVNDTLSSTFLLTNLQYGELNLRLGFTDAWDLDTSHDIMADGGITLQVHRLSHITVEGPATLRQIHCSGVWEEGTFSATGVLTDLVAMEIPASFEGRGGNIVMHNTTGLFHATSPGIAEVVATFAGHQALWTVTAVEESLYFEGVSVDSTPSTWTGPRGSVLDLEPVFTPALHVDKWFPMGLVAQRVIKWTSSDPHVIEVSRDHTASLILRNDWYQPVTVTGVFIQCLGYSGPPLQPVSRAITVNIAPSSTGDLDLGAADGPPLLLTPVGETMQIPMFVYVAAGFLQSFLLDVEVVGSGLGPENCSPGLLPNDQCAVTKTRTRFAGAFSNSQLTGRILFGTLNGTAMLDSLVVVHVHLVQCVVSEELITPRSASFVLRVGSGQLSTSSVGPGTGLALRRVIMPGGSSPASRVYGDTDGDGAFTPMDVLFMEKYTALGVLNRPERVCVLKTSCQLTTRLSTWQLLQLKPVRNPNLPASRPDGGDVLFLLMALVGKTFFLAGLDLTVTPGTLRIRVDLRDFEQRLNPENAVVVVGLTTTLNREMAFDSPFDFLRDISTLMVKMLPTGVDTGFQTTTLPTTMLVDEQSVSLRITVVSLDEWASQLSASVPDRRFTFAPGGPVAVFNIMGTKTSLPIPLPVVYVPTVNCEFLCDDAGIFMDTSLGPPEWINATAVRAVSVIVSSPLSIRNRWGTRVPITQPNAAPLQSDIVPVTPPQDGVIIDTEFNVTLTLDATGAGVYTIEASALFTPFLRAHGTSISTGPVGAVTRLFEAGGVAPRTIQLEFRMLRVGQHKITVSLVESLSMTGLPSIVSEQTVIGIPAPVIAVEMTPLCPRGVVLWSRFDPSLADERCLVEVTGHETGGTKTSKQTLECVNYPCVLQAFGFAVRPTIKTYSPIAVRLILQRTVISLGHMCQWRLVCDTNEHLNLTVSDSAFRGGLISSTPNNALIITVDSIKGNIPGLAAISFGRGIVKTGLNVTEALNPPSRLECVLFTGINVLVDHDTATTTAVFQTPTQETPLLAGSRLFLLVHAVYHGGYSVPLGLTQSGSRGLMISSVHEDVIVSHEDGSFFVNPTSGGGENLHLVTLVYQGVSLAVKSTVVPLIPFRLVACCDMTLAGPLSNLHGHPRFPDSFFIPAPTVFLAEGRVESRLPRLDDSALRVVHDTMVLQYNHTSGNWTVAHDAPRSGRTVISMTYTHPGSLVTLTAELLITLVEAVALHAVGPAPLKRIHCSPTVFESGSVTATLGLVGAPAEPLASLDVTDELRLDIPEPSLVHLEEGPNVLRGLGVGTIAIPVSCRGLSTSLSVTVLDESRVVTSLTAPVTYTLEGVSNVSRFPLELTGILEDGPHGRTLDAVFLADFKLQANRFVSIEGYNLVVHGTNYDEDTIELQASIPHCPLSETDSQSDLTVTSFIKARSVAKPGSIDLEVSLTRSSMDLTLVAADNQTFAFFVHVHTDAIGYSSCTLSPTMPAFTDCVFNQPAPATGEVIIAGASHRAMVGPRIRLGTVVCQSAVTVLWGLVEVFNGFSVKRFSIHAGRLPPNSPSDNQSVALLMPTLPVVDSAVISRAFASLFDSRTQSLRDCLFQLALLVNRQRLVDARVYSNEYELSVMLFVTDRFLRPVSAADVIRVRFHTDQLKITDSTPDPDGGEWVSAQRVLDGLYTVELRQGIPQMVLSLSFTVQTPISQQPWLWQVSPPVKIGEPLQPCPRSATQTATFLASFHISLPPGSHANISELLQEDFIQQVACSVQVPARRLLMHEGGDKDTIYLSVALESLSRVHQTNMVLMGGWLTDEIQRRLSSHLPPTNQTFITIERDQLLFVNDSRDPPRPCPNGYFFSRNGTYHPLPLHSVPGPDCYGMFCLQGYTEVVKDDGSGLAHCIPTPVPIDIVWVCIIVILTAVLALASVACCVHFALWTTAPKPVQDVIMDPISPPSAPDPTSPRKLVDREDPFDESPQQQGLYFQNIITSAGMDDVSLSMMMDDDTDPPTPFNGFLHGILLPHDKS